MSSGGKDSTLAFDRAEREGLDVRWLANLYHGETGRVAFHGVRTELIAAQAAALGLEHVTGVTGPEEYEPVFLGLLDRLKALGCEGIVFGNIHLADVRAWYETRVTRAALRHVEPLWDSSPAAILDEVIDLGYRATVVSVDTQQAPADLLGADLDAAFRDRIKELGIDPCGEKGEYHTFVWGGPTFDAPLPIILGERREEKGHVLLDLTLPG